MRALTVISLLVALGLAADSLDCRIVGSLARYRAARRGISPGQRRTWGRGRNEPTDLSQGAGDEGGVSVRLTMITDLVDWRH